MWNDDRFYFSEILQPRIAKNWRGKVVKMLLMRKKTKEKSGAVALRGRKNSLKEPLRCCAIETPSIETRWQNLYFQSRSSFFLFD